MDPTGPSLAARAARAVRWSALTTAARFALQLGAQVALARLLGPGPYGAYGLGIAVLTFAGFLAGTGFSHSLVLRDRVGEADIRLAFTWQLLAGAACALAMALGAPAAAAFFGTPALAPVLRWLALACVLTAASGTALCLLQRALDFRRLGLLQLAAYAAGYLACGLPLALAGWGAQALAMAAVAQAAATLAGAWWLRPHPVRPLLRHDDGGQALDTGRAVFITNLANWLLANLDRLVIGRALQAHGVGLYTLAWNLAQIPVTLLLGAVQPAFLASGAKLAGDARALARGWLAAVACALVLLVPAATVLALLAPALVRLLYGPAWTPAGAVLALLLACLPAWALWGLSTPVLWHTGRRRLEARLQWPVLALALPAWWWLAPQGLAAVAAVTALALHLRALATVRAALQALSLPGARLLPLALRGAGLALACGAGTAAGLALATVAAPGGAGFGAGDGAAGGAAGGAVQAAASLALGGLGALAAAAGLVGLRPALLGEEARTALRQLRPLRPQPAPGGSP
ncbi:oligosaccharide flippase family protein [Ramlibacter sp. MAHUQ-53]|uniref:oligosaccharide flippase family protein n=1 Tax=unclassified Ramlibacter TaxID=2617605 RepID=UPI003632F86B